MRNKHNWHWFVGGLFVADAFQAIDEQTDRQTQRQQHCVKHPCGGGLRNSAKHGILARV